MDKFHTAISPAIMALINRGAESYLEEIVQLREHNKELVSQIEQLTTMLNDDPRRTISTIETTDKPKRRNKVGNINATNNSTTK